MAETSPNRAPAAEGAASPGIHPDADVLTAFGERSLPGAERAVVLDHLAQCGDCGRCWRWPYRKARLRFCDQGQRATGVVRLASSSLGAGRRITWPPFLWCATVPRASTRKHYGRSGYDSRSGQLCPGSQSKPVATPVPHQVKDR